MSKTSLECTQRTGRSREPAPARTTGRAAARVGCASAVARESDMTFRPSSLQVLLTKCTWCDADHEAHDGCTHSSWAYPQGGKESHGRRYTRARHPSDRRGSPTNPRRGSYH